MVESSYGELSRVEVSCVEIVASSDGFSILLMLSLNKSYKNRQVSLSFHCKYKYFDTTVQGAEHRRQQFYFSFAVCCKRQA